MKESRIIRPVDSELEMPREKPRRLWISLSYRLVRIGRKILGSERVLRFCLNGAWLLWRHAFETSVEVHGEDFYPHTRALSEDFLRRRIPAGGSFIDIGCGYGDWCRIASKYARTTVGIDFNEVKIRQAKKEPGDIEFFVGDVTKELQNRTFDVALLSHVIEHIDEADEFLQKLTRTAKTLIVEVPDFANDPLNWVRVQQNCWFYTDGDHVREYTLDGLSAQIERSGWQIAERERRNGSLLIVAKNGSML